MRGRERACRECIRRSGSAIATRPPGSPAAGGRRYWNATKAEPVWRRGTAARTAAWGARGPGPAVTPPCRATAGVSEIDLLFRALTDVRNDHVARRPGEAEPLVNEHDRRAGALVEMDKLQPVALPIVEHKRELARGFNQVA